MRYISAPLRWLLVLTLVLGLSVSLAGATRVGAAPDELVVSAPQETPAADPSVDEAGDVPIASDPASDPPSDTPAVAVTDGPVVPVMDVPAVGDTPAVDETPPASQPAADDAAQAAQEIPVAQQIPVADEPPADPGDDLGGAGVALGSVTVVKLSCDASIDLAAVTAAAVTSGAIDPASLGCELASGVDFTVDDPLLGTTATSATGANGQVTFDDLTVGNTVTLTETAPVGFEPQGGSASRDVVVVDGDQQLFVNVAVDGTPVTALIIVKLNCNQAIDVGQVDVAAVIAGTADVASLGCTLASGVDFTVTDPLSGTTIGSGTTLNGVATVVGIPVGSSVEIDEATQAGFTPQQPEPRQVTVADGQTELFVNIADAPVVTADVEIRKLNCDIALAVDTGEVLSGTLTDAELLALGCVEADGVDFTVTDTLSGTVLDAGVTVDGSFVAGDLVAAAAVTITETVPVGFDAVTPTQSIVVAAGLQPLFVNISQGDPTPGTVTVSTIGPDDAPLPGACYEVRTADGTVVGTACDADDGADDGTTVVEDLPLGALTAVQTTPPAGFDAADPQDVTLTLADPDAAITVRNDNGGDGSATVTTQDADGGALLDACYEVQDARGTTVGAACDGDDGDRDGVTVVADLAPGTFDLIQTVPPAGFDAAAPVSIDITPADADIAVTVVNDAGDGTVTVRSVDPAGDPLAGACYEVRTADGTVLGAACDDDGDGTVEIGDLPIGDLVLVQTTPPAGFPMAGDVPFALTAADPDETLTVVSGDAAGTVTVDTTQPGGAPLPGACYEVRAADGGLVGQACDGDDGADDGTTVIDGLPEGDFDLIQTVTPDGFAPAAVEPFAVTDDEPDASVAVRNQPLDGGGTGTAVIVIVDEDGNPVPDVCIRIQETGDEACDGDDGSSDGSIEVGGLAIGEYTVIVTDVPDGFEIPQPGEFRINVAAPGEVATITIRIAEAVGGGGTGGSGGGSGGGASTVKALPNTGIGAYGTRGIGVPAMGLLLIAAAVAGVGGLARRRGMGRTTA